MYGSRSLEHDRQLCAPPPAAPTETVLCTQQPHILKCHPRQCRRTLQGIPPITAALPSVADLLLLQDEAACIGCKQCVWCASGVFRMEPEFGRSRAFAQWCDTEDRIQVGAPGLPATRLAMHHQLMHCSWRASRWAHPVRH